MKKPRAAEIKTHLNTWHDLDNHRVVVFDLILAIEIFNGPRSWRIISIVKSDSLNSVVSADKGQEFSCNDTIFAGHGHIKGIISWSIAFGINQDKREIDVRTYLKEWLARAQAEWCLDGTRSAAQLTGRYTHLHNTI